MNATYVSAQERLRVLSGRLLLVVLDGLDALRRAVATHHDVLGRAATESWTQRVVSPVETCRSYCMQTRAYLGPSCALRAVPYGASLALLKPRCSTNKPPNVTTCTHSS